jgi:hypothetical protein
MSEKTQDKVLGFVAVAVGLTGGIGMWFGGAKLEQTFR